MDKTENKINPAIYVGTYGKYNSGSIQGSWLKLRDYKTLEEFYTACKKLHDNEYDPEFMFQDWESIPEIFISESWIDPMFFDLLNWHENIDLEAFYDYLDNVHGSIKATDEISELIEGFEMSYFQNWDSFKDFVYDYYDNLLVKCCNNFKDWYFDYDKLENELLHEYTYTDKGNVFSNY